MRLGLLLTAAIAVSLAAGCGQPVGPEHELSRAGDGFAIDLPAEVPTVWYLIQVMRAKD